MELKIWKWKISITQIAIPRRRYRRKTIKRPEQIQWISILQSEESKAINYPNIILGAGFAMCAITVSIILLLQGAVSQVSTISPNVTNSISPANVIAATNNLKVQNFIFSFQGAVLLLMAIMAVVLLSQIISGVYNKRAKQLRTYLLERYKFDDDIKAVMMHITKDMR